MTAFDRAHKENLVGENNFQVNEFSLQAFYLHTVETRYNEHAYNV